MHNLARTCKTIALLSVFLLASSYASYANADSSSLNVTKSSMSFISYDSVTYVTSIGMIKNITDNTVNDVTLEAQFYDKDGTLIDVITENLYSISIPPQGDIAFKLQTMAAKSKEQYATHNVRAISLDEDKPCPTNAQNQDKPKNNRYYNALINWAPFIVIMIIWLFFIKKYSGKTSPQSKTVELIEKQNELIEKQTTYFGRIADAAEKNHDTKKD